MSRGAVDNHHARLMSSLSLVADGVVSSISIVCSRYSGLHQDIEMQWPELRIEFSKDGKIATIKRHSIPLEKQVINELCEILDQRPHRLMRSDETYIPAMFYGYPLSQWIRRLAKEAGI